MYEIFANTINIFRLCYENEKICQNFIIKKGNIGHMRSDDPFGYEMN